MTNTIEQKVEKLWNEIQDLEWKIIEEIETLINAKWNAPTLKKRIEKNVKILNKIHEKWDTLYEKLEQEKEEGK